jgi:hypothetical protein
MAKGWPFNLKLRDGRFNYFADKGLTKGTNIEAVFLQSDVNHFHRPGAKQYYQLPGMPRLHQKAMNLLKDIKPQTGNRTKEGDFLTMNMRKSPFLILFLLSFWSFHRLDDVLI